jgi:D-alanyl-lipoteichoic acid acyltransferase DltB (MBOAT superfamily)
VLAVGVAANLGLLGYFKYANFYVDSVNSALGTAFHLETILLPLAISFFTFYRSPTWWTPTGAKPGNTTSCTIACS